MRWEQSDSKYLGGRFQVEITKLLPGGQLVDATQVRGIATQIGGLSSADPFGDSTAELTFPGLTPMDDLKASDLITWLDYYSNVDVYWIPALDAWDPDDYPGEPLVYNEMSGQINVITPKVLRGGSGLSRTLVELRYKIWEGFIASMNFSQSATSASLTVQCQGALFQLDRYLQKPFYPPQPWPLELLIADCFDSAPGQPRRKPNLRLQPLKTIFPAGWKLLIPPYSNTGSSIYTPVGTPGSKWSGYTNRNTGAWEHSLTGFVQDQLTPMITDERSGVTLGNQWTILHARESGNPTDPLTESPTGRQPVLTVRDRFRTPDFTLVYGIRGMTADLQSDSTQSENVIYGTGVGVDGTTWRGAVISNDGSRTDYTPLAASRQVYPPGAAASENATTPDGASPTGFLAGAFVSEAYTNFGSGFDQSAATGVAEQQLARDMEPGWTGKITIASDPSPTFSRWRIQAGMTMKLQNVLGTGANGINFHISAVTKNPFDGTVEMTVDTRFRDLLTVDEAISRTRDPLTPVKMLQVNRTSVMIDDIEAPWDYSAGSGYVPKAAKAFYDYVPQGQTFPYLDWREKHPPLHYASWYVKVNANAPSRTGRWSGPIPILTSEKDTINRAEFEVCDIYGRPLKVPFHVSLYYTKAVPGDMPRDAQGPSPYINGAFETLNPATGQPWPPGNFLAPQNSMIIGWGNRSQGVFDRAGFYPGREPNGVPPTGLFVDDGTWSFDNTSNPNFIKNLLPGQKETASSITIYAEFYCEYSQPVYFMGRLFRQNPGVS